MKKNLIFLFAALVVSLTAVAGPAYPGRIEVTQPDGTTIGIYLHGDEFCHWATNDAGQILTQDENGFWTVASGLDRQTLTTRQEAAAIRRAAAQEAFKAAASTSANFGSPKIPVILVGFKDKAFSKTNAQFDAMLNTPGYSDNSAIGSVWDYYNENSFGAFTPVFEVLGPVTLDNNMSYYGGNDTSGNDKLPEMALVHAAQKLDSTVDFSRYDNDGDGTVDFVLFYFAGYDEAQGGSTSCIWSHAWYLQYSSNVTTTGRTFDGVKLNRYFCTAELKGSSGSTMCSIGTTCHEFAHTLGLPDFYDADYSTNGSAANMYNFSLMANGSYNGNSTTPPYLTAEEVYEIGWLSDIPELTSTDAVTLPAINYQGASAYSAYKTKTSVTNEYFVYEVRRGGRWDAQIPTGLLVYHVDKSSNTVSGSVKASSTWSSNSVNNYSAHPCCYVVPAANPTQTTLYSGSSFLFGGSNYKAYTPTAWNGNTTGFALTNITYSNGVVTFNVRNSNTLGITGSVMNSDGEPLAGATLTFNVEAQSAPAKVKAAISSNALLSKVRSLLFPSKNQTKAMAKAAAATTTTGEDGSYLVELEAGTYTVTASKEGYVSQSATVAVTSMIETQSFYLLREGEELPSVIYAWPVDEELDEYIVGTSSSTALTGQNLYPTSEIAPYAGKQLKEFTFYLVGNESTTYEGVCVIIDYGDERKATIPVNSSDLNIGDYTTVDLRDYELVVPSNRDIFAGVGYSKGGYSYNNGYYAFGAYYKTAEDDDGNEYTLDWAKDWPYDGLVSEYSLTSTGERYSWDLIFDFTLTLGDFEAPDTGYDFISDLQNGSYAAGDVLPLTLIETEGDRKPAGAISWYYDDEPVTGDSITLTSGTHVVEARFTTVGGKSKVVELEITVQ